MSYSVQHTNIGQRPYWYQLERWDEGHREKAFARARQYALDHGGYVCVKDYAGNVVFGTDPTQLDRAITLGINKHFAQRCVR